MIEFKMWELVSLTIYQKVNGALLPILRKIFRGAVLAGICDARLLVETFLTPAVGPTLPDLVFPVSQVLLPPSSAALFIEGFQCLISLSTPRSPNGPPHFRSLVSVERDRVALTHGRRHFHPALAGQWRRRAR